jgi:hypothetical protein
MSEKDAAKPYGVVHDEEIHLEQAKFRRLARQGSETPFEEMEADDAEACRQLGMFFANNHALADYAIDIEWITLTPRTDQGGEVIAPLASLAVNRRGKRYRLKTDGNGVLPPLPFGR